MQQECSYNALVDLINETLSHYGDKFKLNKEKLGDLEKICDTMDSFAEMLDAESMLVEVLPERKEVCFRLYMCDMVFKNGRSHDFFEIIKMFDSFSFSNNNDMLMLTLSIHKMWC